MNAKKPPLRPPAPRGPTASNTSVAKNGGSAVNTPGKLRSALASLSIRYNPANSSIDDSDSDEEISIVRKESKLSPDLDAEDEDFTIVQNDGSVTQLSTGTDSEDSATTTHSHNNSSTESLQQDNNEKRTIVKQHTWPGNAKINPGVKSTSSLTTGMRFLRREQPTTTARKDQADVKDEADLGSQPSKSHLSLHAKGSDSESNRSRSPSPFRRLYRQANNDSVSSVTTTSNNSNNSTEKLASATVSAISLSSLLATEDKNAQNEEKEQENLTTENLQKDDVSGDEISISVPPSELQQSQTNENVSTEFDYEPPFTFLLYLVLLFYGYLITELPVFVNGMVVGGIFAYLVGCLFLLVISPEGSLGERFQRELDEYNLRLARKPKPTYTSKDPGLLLRPKGMKGWVLKTYDYDQNSAPDTTLVYAELKDNHLILSHPKQDGKKIDIKTVHDNSNVMFVRHDHFNLTDSYVCLVPPTLSPKRIWSKKYPICIVLGESGEERQEVKDIVRSNSSETEQTNGKKLLEKVKSQSSVDGVSVLYLYAKTGRQKEEWYQHFDRILKQKRTELQQTPSCSYPHYMAKLLPSMDASEQDTPEVQLAWLNMLFGRVFWDVWQDRYWADKIKQRFQNKLSRVHKPQFIRDIHITDLSLGHTFPLIHKVSPPVLDEQGTWVDFDVTYCGGVVFTVETHLNIDGYLNYFLSLGKEKELSGDLDMTELSRKYEIIEKDEILEEMRQQQSTDDDNQSLTSESPPDSDSDFESPESDLEEFTSKLKTSRPSSYDEDESLSSNNASSSSENLAFMQLKALEGFLENQIAEDEMNLLEVAGSSTLSLSQDSLSNTDNGSEYDRYSPSTLQKDSSTEESSEKLSLSPPPSANMKQRLLDAPTSVRQRIVAKKEETGTRKKLIGVLERLAKSKWVKKAAETKIVKTAAEKFSNLPIILSVEVQSVKGTLTLNIPPPPTNRLWYGFRDDPLLFVTARPKLGARQVKLTHVTDWIERKLKHEFKSMFVLPNMEDISIKIMNSDVEKQFADN